MSTKIEWCDETWNPLAGCSVTSPGCKSCYAMRLAARLERMGMEKYAGLTQPSKAGAVWTGEVRLDDEALLQPLRWKKPRRIFVNSMSDLFHESVPDEWIDRIFAVMALAPQHTFQVLTKRADRMREYMTAGNGAGAPQRQVDFLRGRLQNIARGERSQFDALDHLIRVNGWSIYGEAGEWPLPNVWLGVSVEDQQRADERIPDLLATPAAVRFLSCEPLLEEIDISNWLWAFKPCDGCPCPDPQVSRKGFEECCREPDTLPSPIHWVIAGGESGPGARPMHPAWDRSLHDQCAVAGVPYFKKQNGEWMDFQEAKARISADVIGRAPIHRFEDGTEVIRVGKKRAGRLLDGVEHNGFPVRS